MSLLYNAGNLFNEAEVAQRKKEGEILRKELPEIEIYNPIDAPVNNKITLPSAEDIYHLDTLNVQKSDYIIADLTNNDVGTAAEIGIALTINSIIDNLRYAGFEDAVQYLNKIGFVEKQKIIGVASDIRQTTANHYEDYRIPYGLNQYVVGGILYHKGSGVGHIVLNFNEAVELIKEDVEK